MPIPFLKMNGAGNDFVMLDGRKQEIALTSAQIRRIAARDNPVTKGCDQVIVMEPSGTADVFMRIYNADGGEVDACGNATRCVAELLEKELGRLPVRIQTNAGMVKGVQKERMQDKEYMLVDMGKPKLEWEEIPMAMPFERARMDIERRFGLKDPCFVNMGNPHVVFFLGFTPQRQVSTLKPLLEIDLEGIGPALEQWKDMFPQGVNVSVATLNGVGMEGRCSIHARVWERGAGFTQSCGTAACAMLAAANRRLPELRSAFVWFEPQGVGVSVALDEGGHILLGGPVETEFSGEMEL